MRKSVRKFTGILLAVIMFVTAVFPQQGMAAENNALEREAAEKVKAHSEGEAEKEKAFLSEDAVTEELSRKRDSSEQDQIPETEQLPEAQGGGLENPAGHELPFTEEAEGRTFMLPGGSEDILPQADSYDIYPPVIENFEFEENGDALTVNDILHFTVSAYDADGEIQSIVVSVSCSDAQGSGASVTLEKSGEGNLYAGTISCSSLKGRNFYISGIYAEDKANNYVNWKTWDENGQYKYQFTLDAEVNIDENVLVSNFRMQANPANEDGKLRAGDMVTYTADVTCKSS